MPTVVLDTNALLMPFEIRINLDLAIQELLGEARVLVPGPLVGELKHLDNRNAPAALALARKYEIVPTVTTGDDSVIELASKEHAYVLTNDKELRRRLRKERIPIICLRSGTHLAVDPYLGERPGQDGTRSHRWPRWGLADVPLSIRPSYRHPKMLPEGVNVTSWRPDRCVPHTSRGSSPTPSGPPRPPRGGRWNA